MIKKGNGNKRRLGLYIHIPFCVRKCAYCDFLSWSANQSEMKMYVKALQTEIATYENAASSFCVDTVFIGGGTPSILPNGEINRIMNALRNTFSIDENAEITLELNPGTATKTKMLEYKHSGINRISIGLQSADDNELRMLGRIHTYKQFLDTYECVLENGIGNVNVDIMSALPDQTVEHYLKTVRSVLALPILPAHISAYSLIVEEGTPFYKMYGDDREHNDRTKKLPSEDEERKMYWETAKMLESNGYLRYEISNYAKDGFLCRHNLKYWDCKEYLGIGLGASSLIDGERFSHIKDQSSYEKTLQDCVEKTAFCANDKLQVEGIIHKKEALTPQQKMEEFMFLGLRKGVGVLKSDFYDQFGNHIEQIFQAPIRQLIQDGLLENKNDRYYLTKKGIDFGNYVFAKFLL